MASSQVVPSTNLHVEIPAVAASPPTKHDGLRLRLYLLEDSVKHIQHEAKSKDQTGEEAAHFFTKALRDLLLERQSVITKLCAIAKANQESIFFDHLIDFFEAYHRMADLAKNAISEEMLLHPDTVVILRDESVASELIGRIFFRAEGKAFLQRVMGPTIKKVATSENSLQTIGPVGGGIDPEANQTVILFYCQQILQSLLASASAFPADFSDILRHIDEKTGGSYTARWQNGGSLISSILFLRFVVRAIIYPSLIDIDQPLNEDAKLALLQIAKILQCLANSTPYNSEKPFAKMINEFITAQYPLLNKFVDAVLKNTEGPIRSRPADKTKKASFYTKNMVVYLGTRANLYGKIPEIKDIMAGYFMYLDFTPLKPDSPRRLSPRPLQANAHSARVRSSSTGNLKLDSPRSSKILPRSSLANINKNDFLNLVDDSSTGQRSGSEPGLSSVSESPESPEGSPPDSPTISPVTSPTTLKRVVGSRPSCDALSCYSSPQRKKELLKAVNKHIMKEWGLVGPPVTIHQPLPNVYASFWMVLHESMLVGNVPRFVKETMATAVSSYNSCKYMIQEHQTISRALRNGAPLNQLLVNSASASSSSTTGLTSGYTAAAEEDEGFLANLYQWTLATAHSADFLRLWGTGSVLDRGSVLSNPPFAPSKLPEYVSVVVFFNYINRVMLAAYGQKNWLPNWVVKVMFPVVKWKIRSTSKSTKIAGNSLHFLPLAEVPADVNSWTKDDVHIGRAFGSLISSIREEATEHLPGAVIQYIERKCKVWQGTNKAFMEECFAEAETEKHAAIQAALLFCIKTAFDPSSVSPADVQKFQDHHPSREAFLSAVCFSAITAARSIGSWVVAAVKDTDAKQRAEDAKHGVLFAE